MFVPGITYPKLQNISLKGAERMKKARAMAVLVIVAVLVCAAFAISKNSAEKRKQMIAQKYGPKTDRRLHGQVQACQKKACGEQA